MARPWADMPPNIGITTHMAEIVTMLVVDWDCDFRVSARYYTFPRGVVLVISKIDKYLLLR